MKRSTRWVIGISCFIIAICAALLVLIYSLQVPADFRQLRNGMTQEEVNSLLGGEPNLVGYKEQPGVLKPVRTPPDIQDAVADNLDLLALGQKKLGAVFVGLVRLSKG